MLLAAATAFVQRAWAVLLLAAMGLVRIGFEIFEVAIIPSTVVFQFLISGPGLVIFALAFSFWMSGYRIHHFPISR